MLIKSDAIYLRSPRKIDAEVICKAVNNDEIRYLTGTTSTFTSEQIERHMEKCALNETRVDFVVCLIETDEVIGEGAILEVERENNLAYYRIAMFPEFIGRGYGTETTRLAVDYAFDILKLNRLQLEVYTHNPRAQRSYEKVGFKKEGTRRQVVKWQDHYFDEIIMSILRAEWINSRKV